MKRRRFKREHGFGEVNVTPLIDVVMCLIIFYLMVGKLATDRKTPVVLPTSEVGSEGASERHTLIVNVSRRSGAEAGTGAEIVVDGEAVEGEESLVRLVRMRLAEDAALVVQIRAEADFAFGVVGPVMRACTRGGAKSVVLAARREAEGG